MRLLQSVPMGINTLARLLASGGAVNEAIAIDGVTDDLGRGIVVVANNETEANTPPRIRKVRSLAALIAVLSRSVVVDKATRVVIAMGTVLAIFLRRVTAGGLPRAVASFLPTRRSPMLDL